MENKKLISVLIHDLKELEGLLGDIKDKKAINLFEIEFIQAKAAGVRKLLEIYSEWNPGWAKVVPVVGKKPAASGKTASELVSFDFPGVDEPEDEPDDLNQIPDEEPIGEILVETPEEKEVFAEPEFLVVEAGQEIEPLIAEPEDAETDNYEPEPEEELEPIEPEPEMEFELEPEPEIESEPEPEDEIEPEIEWVIDEKPAEEDRIDSPEDEDEEIAEIDEGDLDDDFEKIEEEEPEQQEEELPVIEADLDEAREEYKTEPAIEPEPVAEIEPEEVPEVEPEIVAEPEPEPVKKPDPQMEVKFHEVQEPEPESQVLGEKFQKERSVNDVKYEGSIKLEEKLSSMPLKSIRSAIGINDRFLFTRELFDGNPELFNMAVTKLDNMEDIKDAVVFLRDNFKWKKNETSLKFVELVKRRFSNE